MIGQSNPLLGIGVLATLYGDVDCNTYRISNFIGNSTPTLFVAASNAPTRIRNVADYTCDGEDDDVQIQAAIDALEAYPLGGKVVLSEGTFYVGTKINLRGRISVVASCIAGTTVVAATGTDLYPMNDDVFSFAPDSTQTFCYLQNFYIDGNRMKDHNDTGDQVGCYDRITGLSKGVNTTADGDIYLSIISDGGGYYHIEFYKSAADQSGVVNRTAYTATYNSSGLKTLTEDNGSGIGGSVGVFSVTQANATIYLRGNWSGSAIVNNSHGYDLHILNMNIMNMAEHAVELEEAWGSIIDDLVAEFNAGDGIHLSSGTRGKIINIKSIDNGGHGIYCNADGTMIANCEVSAGENAANGLHETGKAGIYLDGQNCSVVNAYSGVFSGNYGFAVLESRCALTNCKTTANGSTSNNIGFYQATGSGDQFTSCKAVSFSGSGAYGYRITGAENTIVGSDASACVVGISLTGNYNAVTGGRIDDCTTGLDFGTTVYSKAVGIEFKSNTTALTTGNLCRFYSIVGCSFFYGTTGINVGASSGTTRTGVVADCVFANQSTLPVNDQTADPGIVDFIGNSGCANYKAGTRYKITGATLSPTVAQSDCCFVHTADCVVTMPAIETGCRYEFVNGGKSTNVQITITPQAGDSIDTPNNEGTASKSIINTKATTICGDRVKLVATDANTWKSDGGLIGVWAVDQL